MPLSFTDVRGFPALPGGLKLRVVDITLDNAYPTGGWTVTPANFKLSGLFTLIIPHCTNGYVLEYDATNRKIKAYQAPSTGSNPLTQLPNNSNVLNNVTIRCLAIGW